MSSAGLYALYLIGEPGVGKTTILTAALADIPVVAECDRYTVLGKNLRGRQWGWELGRRRKGGFSGTDALGMAVQPEIVAEIRTGLPPVVIGEGDRLGNAKFFGALQQCDYVLDVVYLDASPVICADRRAQRGSSQDDAWIRGRRTKARHLAYQFHAAVLNGAAPVAELVAALRARRAPAQLLLG